MSGVLPIRTYTYRFQLGVDEQEERTMPEKATDRLEMLVRAARKTGLTIDVLDYLTDGLCRHACLKVIGNASSMPSTMKSSDNPYVFRSARAPSKEIR